MINSTSQCPSRQNGGTFQVAVHSDCDICDHHIDLVHPQRVENGPDEEKGDGGRRNGDCVEYCGQSQCLTSVPFWCNVLSTRAKPVASEDSNPCHSHS